MKYVCGFCGLVSENIERARECEAQGISARYKAEQKVVFLWPKMKIGARLEIKGVIQEVVHAFRTHRVTYRILVGEDPRLRHQNCIYGGVPDEHVLRLAK